MDGQAQALSLQVLVILALLCKQVLRSIKCKFTSHMVLRMATKAIHLLAVSLDY